MKSKLVLPNKAPVFIFLSIAILIAGKNFQPVLAKVRSSGKNTVAPSKDNFALGMSRYKQHDLDGAIDAFLQAIYFNRSSYYPQAYYWLGLCYQDKKLDAKAIDALKRSIEQTIGAAADAHIHLAQLYLRNDRLQEAEFEASKAWADSKSLSVPEVHNLLGLIADRRGNLRSAQDQFIEALGEKPWRYTEAWMNYAENLIKQKSWGDAVVQLRDMLNNPAPLKNLDCEKIYLDIGVCLLAKGDHQGALDNWHEALNYNPDNAMAHLQLALLLDSERHISSAIKEYKEYIRLSPESNEVAKIKNRLLVLEQILRSTTAGSPDDGKFLNEGDIGPKGITSPEEAGKESEGQKTVQTKDKETKTKNSVPATGKESGF